MNLFLVKSYVLIMNFSKHFRICTLGIINIFSNLVHTNRFFCLEFNLLTKKHHFSTEQYISPYSSITTNTRKKTISHGTCLHAIHDDGNDVQKTEPYHLPIGRRWPAASVMGVGSTGENCGIGGRRRDGDRGSTAAGSWDGLGITTGTGHLGRPWERGTAA